MLLSMEQQAFTAGIHHLGLTVPNVERARDFFVEVLDFQLVRERPDYPAAFVSDGHVLLTLWQATDPAQAIPFDRKQGIGLHHFALTLRSSSDLQMVYERLKAASDVKIEFAPEPLAGGPTQHLMCTIPGGIRMEIISPAA
jgi:catechol 2,3-dioxygenase-like lactoylglutathione lyase family enzyme